MTAFAKSCQHPWQIRVVGTSYSPHHVAMNEFVDPSQQPTDNPRRRSAKWFPEPDDSRRSNVPAPPLSELELTPAAPAAQPGRSPPPIQVRVVWYGETGEVAYSCISEISGQVLIRGVPAGQRAFGRSAEGVGFEPTRTRQRPSGFQGR